MKLYTSYYGNVRKLTEHGVLAIGISVQKPKFLEIPMIPELAPTYKMMSMPFDEYKVEYIKILDKLDMTKIGALIGKMAQGKDVALCCYESLKKPNEWCHRTMLAEYLNEKIQGRKYPEWVNPDDIAKAKAAEEAEIIKNSQQKLF